MKYRIICLLFITVLFLCACNDESNMDINKLDINITDAIVWADYREPVADDPIGCIILMDITNQYEFSDFLNIQISDIQVFNQKDDELLGVFIMETEWDGTAPAGETCHPCFTKIPNDIAMFSTSIIDTVYINFDIKHQSSLKEFVIRDLEVLIEIEDEF